MSDDSHQRVEHVASAIEDLIQMGIIELQDKKADEATLSSQFAQIATNVMSDMKLGTEASKDQVMKLMYYSLLIYMTEHLKMPRPLIMALGNDMEKNRNNMESGELVTTYVSVLSRIWSRRTQATKTS